MDINQQVLIKLLSSAIRGRKPQNIETMDVNWTTVYKEARKHDVHTLLYSVLKDMEPGLGPNEELLREWQKSTLLAAVYQYQHIEQASRVLDAFNKEGILVIALKGLVLRDLYPQPELRTMGDADVLIHKEDLEAAKNLLAGLGYEEEGCSAKHIHFSHKDYPMLEVHWTLVDSKKFKTAGWFDKAVWESAVTHSLCEVSTLALSTENELLHLCLHMAGHIMSGGFGLRQLCDFMLLIEARKQAISWNSFIEKAHNCGLKSFVYIILEACRQLFDLELPEALDKSIIVNNAYVDELIYDILDGGVFGKSSMDREAGNIFIQYLLGEGAGYSHSLLKRYRLLLLPPSHKMPNKYEYARRCPLLLPAAWMHRLIYIVFRKDYSLEYKKLFLSPKATAPVLDRRSKLLQKLGLQ
jgi:hypothetical protein